MRKIERNGIAVAGSVLVDKINEIKAYPQIGELTQIAGLEKAVGGCVPNVALDLKKICPEMGIQAIGKIGDHEEGLYVSEVLSQGGVDVSGFAVDKNDKTSFTEVMSVINGQRTFFTYPGTSADFGYDDIDFENLNAKILHLGYFLLLEKVDQGDGLAILKKAKELGMMTSIDLVSENSDRYSLVLPCLPYTDYLIINENEAGKLTDIEPTDENMESIAYKLKELGVQQKVVIHKPDYAVCLSEEGYTVVPSYKIPDDYIKGTTGAGDAFCAGTLVGIYKGWTLSKKYGVPLEDIMLHRTDLLERFTNAALRDTCSRVGREPARKLSPKDRLIGSASLALEMDVTPAYIAIGAAAGLCRYMNEAEDKTLTAEAVLAGVSELDINSELAKLILEMYELIRRGKSFGEIRRVADKKVVESLQNVI